MNPGNYRAVFIVLVLEMVLWAGPLLGSPGRSQQDSSESLTTDVWQEPKVPLDLHWHILSVPERMVELTFLPVSMLVTGIERTRLDRRIYDLLRNDAGTVVVSPQVKVGFGDGLGIGGTLTVQSRLGQFRKWSVGGLWQLNNDREWATQYKQSLAFWEGRRIRLRVRGETDRDAKYYGRGNDTVVENKRVLRNEFVEGAMRVSLIPRGMVGIASDIEVGFRREQLGVGQSGTTPSVEESADDVELPAGFGSTRYYPWVRVGLRRDTRDTVARTTTGLFAEMEGYLTTDTDSSRLGAVGGLIRAFMFVPVLPGRRVIALGAGVESVSPLRKSGRVPFHSLVTLDRSNHLRGYGSDRFRDRVAWWATAEYHYPVYEYQTTGVALTSVLFGDMGRVAPSLQDAFSTPIRYSLGAELRVEHETVRVLSFQLGWSPEGLQVALRVGKDL